MAGHKVDANRNNGPASDLFIAVHLPSRLYPSKPLKDCSSVLQHEYMRAPSGAALAPTSKTLREVQRRQAWRESQVPDLAVAVRSANVGAADISYAASLRNNVYCLNTERHRARLAYSARRVAGELSFATSSNFLIRPRVVARDSHAKCFRKSVPTRSSENLRKPSWRPTARHVALGRTSKAHQLAGPIVKTP